MTNYNERLDEILDYLLTDIYMNNEHFAANQEALDKTKEEPMQAITSLIKELVADAKPEIPVATSWQEGIEKKAFEDAIRVYEYKLLKALEEV